MKSTVSSPAPQMGQRLTALVLVGLLAGPFMSMIDSSVVNVALAVIARSFKTDLATAQWVISGYLLALAFGLPASAFLAKRYGTRRIYLVSMAGFTLSSLACAFAPTLPVLIATRVLQGFCGAPLVPLAMNVLLGPNGRARRGIPPVAGVLLFLAPALGPTIGGLLLRVGAWPLIFLVNVPIGLLGLIGAARINTEVAGEGDRAARFDPLGLALASFGLTLAIYGATAGAQKSWLGGDAVVNPDLSATDPGDIDAGRWSRLTASRSRHWPGSSPGH
jgi:EmrB/QacA subfamily drug resistance transporter